ncbi:FtsX-like permease family protein [Neomegalonema perideroedes]|uniref:FtsX-like permease family protein n=1 Tax=Neomegalonema perideroedes TaxID=217219 RepID=UPI00037CF1EE|nr:FtsX-like permease family protein [Neomegalonema perideroedes]
MNPFPILRASLARNPFTVLLFIGLIALAAALGVAVGAQERALRQGSARAADKFDLIVAAPGGRTDLLLSTVFLRPSAVELLTPEATAKALNDPDAVFAAPLAFGDQAAGSPVIGTSAAFVEHLSGGLAEGRLFAAQEEAVVGALVAVGPGGALEIRHGDADSLGGGLDADAYEDHDDHDHEHGDEDHGHDHADVDSHGSIAVVGRMRPTGTPWDRAVVVPVEYVWTTHGLGDGQASGAERIGPPWDAARLPGVPAIVMRPESVPAAYGLRARYRTAESTAFFPAEALLDLYEVMGGATRIMSALILTAQILVAAAILAGLLAVLDLQRRRFAMLRALGAPAGFVLLTVWLYVAVMVVAGAVLGLALGWGLSALASGAIGRATGIAFVAQPGWREVGGVGLLAAAALLMALPTAWRVYRRSSVEALR